VSEPKPDPSSLTRDQFARIREIFEKAYELPPGERTILLDRLCGDDRDVRRAVEELLGTSERTVDRYNPEGGGIARRALNTQPTLDDSLPEQIGRYRIKQLIGRGGMGVVYLATQSNPEREVALKILRDSTGSGTLRGRFAREVRVLGRLEHPGIARIYDAGIEPGPHGGTSYFAMEYVRGPRLTDFARENHLSIVARLELIAKTADAVQYAHTKGVIHRDLKPGNILVSEQATLGETAATVSSVGAQPKVLDFGVARLLDPETQHTAISEQGSLLGTVAYMSPEQLSGDPESVDMRSDVYAMGVILYELLSGKLPFDVTGKAIAEAARIIRDDEPAPLIMSDSGEKLDRDVVTIVAKAMAKDRDRRYETAATFADDVRRFLKNEPIAARPPTATYQITKFARRNRGLVSGVVVASCAIITGLVISTVLFAREQQARVRADRAVGLSSAVREYLIHDLLLAASPGRMGYEVKMLDVLNQARDGLHERFADHPEVEGEVRWEIANVYEQLGKNREALEEAELALPLCESALGTDGERAVAVLGLMSQTSRMLEQNDKALQYAQEAMLRAKRSLPDTSKSSVIAFAQAGSALSKLGRYDESNLMLNDAMQRCNRATEPDEHMAISLLNWMITNEKGKGNTQGVVERTREVADRAQKLYGRENEYTIASRSNLANTLLSAGNFAEAATVAADLPAAAEKTFPAGHPGRAYCYLTACAATFRAERYDQAEEFGLKAHAAFKAMFDDVNWSTERAADWLRKTYSKMPGHTAQTEQWCLESARIRLMVANAQELKTTLKTLDDVAIDRTNGGGGDGAITDLIWTKRDELAPPDHPRRALFYANLGYVLRNRQQAERANEALKLAEDSLASAKDPDTVRAVIAEARK
jgi:serine/threonine protein kinase